MPRAKWMSDADYAAYERCLKDLEGKHDINKYAVCMASIKKSKARRKRILKKLK